MNARLNKKTTPTMHSNEYDWEPMFSKSFVKALSEIFFED